MNPNKTLITTVALFAAMFVGTAALAHTDEDLDTQTAPHGGQLRMAGIYHYELVVTKNSPEARDNPILVYVTDHAGVKIPTLGASGTVTLLSGKTKATVTLTPDGDNLMKGVGKYASTPDMKAVVSITLAGKAAEQARFTPLAPPAPSAPIRNEHSTHNKH